MVMDRFGTDLQKKFEEGGKRFPRKLVLQLGLKLVSRGFSFRFYQPSSGESLSALFHIRELVIGQRCSD